MQKRLGQDADELAASSSQIHPEDELYAVPSDLQVLTLRILHTLLLLHEILSHAAWCRCYLCIWGSGASM